MHTTRGLRSTFALGLVAAALCLLVGATGATASGGAESVPFEPITFDRIPLPEGLHETHSPAFTADGKHLLFRGKREVNGETEEGLWISDLKGKKQRCITCSGGPAVPQVNYMFPFQDGKRIFVGFYGVVECAPSVVDCRTHDFLPYDLAGANPPGGVIAPGGAANTTQRVVRQGAYPTLAQDGKHIGYSDVRSDGLEQMVVAKLVRKQDKYVAEDPKVINPHGPTSANDTSVDGWSNSTGLYELKTFTHGGRAVTYVHSGGTHSENPDVWEVDLKTGVRKRLTSHPDWDEDFAGSPDGQSLALWSNRTLHVWDGLGGLMPHRGFIDAPMVAAEAGMLVNTPNNLACGGSLWLMPSDGDRGGTLAGQPIVPPDVHGHTTVVGWSAWSPDGTKLALNALKDGAGLFSGDTPGYLVVARFPARKATAPLPVVDSDVGSWAPAPADWHPAFGFVGTVTLNGPGGGTVTVKYNGTLGAILGDYSATYNNYSEDGKTFLNGTKAVFVPGLGVTRVREVTDLKMTGEHIGSITKDLEIAGGNATGTPTYTGTSKVTYDGTTVTGPPSWLTQKGSCPERLPKAPQLKATATSVGKDRYAIKVTASIAGVGPNEASVDTRPVKQARIDTVGQDAYTDRNGIAVIKTRGNPHEPTTVKVTAGETLAPTGLSIPAGK